MDLGKNELTFGLWRSPIYVCTRNSLALAKFTITWVTSLPVGEPWRRQRQQADRQQQRDSHHQQGNLQVHINRGKEAASPHQDIVNRGWRPLLMGFWPLWRRRRHDIFNAVSRTLITRSKGSPGRDACGEPANRLRGPWNISHVKTGPIFLTSAACPKMQQ